jgi:hypothetical protein
MKKNEILNEYYLFAKIFIFLKFLNAIPYQNSKKKPLNKL